MIPPNAMPVAIAVASCTRISGIGPATSVSVPRIRAAVPVAARMPWLGNFAYSTISTMAPTISASDVYRTGSRFSENSASSTSSVPSAPGMIVPGVLNSM